MDHIIPQTAAETAPETQPTAVGRLSRDGVEYFYTRIVGGVREIDHLAIPMGAAYMLWNENKGRGQAVGIEPVDFEPGFKQWTFVIKFDTM